MDICLWDKCNNKCVMCTNPVGSWEAWDGSFDYDYASLKKRTLKDRQKFEDDDTIYLTGGEPTIHPDFLRFIDFLSNEFPGKRIVLLTNGRRFCYEKFAKDLLDRNLNIEIHVSLYGHNESVHEKITQVKGSYDQSIVGIQNLLKHKKPEQVLAVRHVLSSVSYKYIKNFLELIVDEIPLVDRVILMFWEIEAQAESNFDYLKLKYSDTVDFIKEVSCFLDKINEISLYHFPLCQINESLWPVVWCTWPEHEITWLPVCKQCQVKKYCVGIHKAYLKNIGDKEFKPIKNKRNIKESGNIYQPIKAVH